MIDEKIFIRRVMFSRYDQIQLSKTFSYKKSTPLPRTKIAGYSLSSTAILTTLELFTTFCFSFFGERSLFFASGIQATRILSIGYLFGTSHRPAKKGPMRELVSRKKKYQFTLLPASSQFFLFVNRYQKFDTLLIRTCRERERGGVRGRKKVKIIRSYFVLPTPNVPILINIIHLRFLFFKCT